MWILQGTSWFYWHSLLAGAWMARECLISNHTKLAIRHSQSFLASHLHVRKKEDSPSPELHLSEHTQHQSLILMWAKGKSLPSSELHLSVGKKNIKTHYAGPEAQPTFHSSESHLDVRKKGNSLPSPELHLSVGEYIQKSTPHKTKCAAGTKYPEKSTPQERKHQNTLCWPWDTADHS